MLQFCAHIDVRNITVVSCEECVTVGTCCNISHSPPTQQSTVTTNNSAVRTSHTATVTRYWGRNIFLTGGSGLVKCHDLSHWLLVLCHDLSHWLLVKFHYLSQWLLVKCHDLSCLLVMYHTDSHCHCEYCLSLDHVLIFALFVIFVRKDAFMVQGVLSLIN